jgi:hypothetical protein
MTLHSLYLRHGTALDCARLAREMSTPEHGVSEFEAFCRVVALLDAPGFIECRTEDTGWFSVGITDKTVGQCFEKACDHLFVLMTYKRHRVVLKDGTVIREWGAK